ncbi:hypothetical protein [Ruminococcus albus]|nr:hypothetical protein [Ruminococcus albus]
METAKEENFGTSLSRKACREPQSAKLAVRGRALVSRHKAKMHSEL